MLSSFLALLLLTLLVGLCYGIGRLLFSKLTAPLSYLERFVFVVPVGMGVVGLVVWLSGLIGVMSPVLYGGLLAVGAGGVAWLLKDRAVKTPVNQRYQLPIALLIAIAVVQGFLRLSTAVGALAPPGILEWDALSYHLANQKLWLLHGRIDYLPFDHHSNFPFVTQMLYLMMLALGSIGAAKLVHWFCFVLLSFSVYTFAVRHITPGDRGRVIGSVASLIISTTPIILWEATTAYVDLASALFTWLSLYALINAAEAVPAATDTSGAPASTASTEEGSKNGSAGWLVMSAVLMGFALGTKYTVLGFWGMLLVGIVCWYPIVHRKFAVQSLAHAALWGAMALAIGLPWYIRNWTVTGNPVYPFAYSIFGGKFWSLENAVQYAEEQARFGMGKAPLDLLLSPWRVTMELNYLPAYMEATGRRFIFTEYIIYGFGLSPVLLALLLALPVIGKRLSRVSVYCLLFGLGVYAFWFLLMQQTRYLIPALPALAVVAGEGLVGLWEKRRGIARSAASGLLILATLWAVFLAGGLAFWGIPRELGGGVRPAWPVVSGQLSAEEYLARALPGLSTVSFWINRNTQPGEKVAIFDETQGFYLDRDYIWAQPDHAAGFVPWDTYTGVDDWLTDFKQKGFTVLLLGFPPESAPQDGKRWRDLLNEAIASDKVTLAFQDKRWQVYRLRQAGNHE